MMMAIGTSGALVMEPQVNVAAMADIVQHLVTGGRSRLQNGRWLRARATVVGLGVHEQAALQSLRLRLRGSSTALLDAALIGMGNW